MHSVQNVSSFARFCQFNRKSPTRFRDTIVTLQHLQLFQEISAFKTSRFSSTQYFDVFLMAGLKQTSLKYMAWYLRDCGVQVPSSEQIHKQCRETPREDAISLVNSLYRMWYHSLPGKFRRQLAKKAIVHIDFHQDPYYGDRSNPDIIQGRVKKSTTSFYEYLTAQISSKVGSQTLAIVPRLKGRSIASHVRELLDYVTQILTPKLVVFDGEFANYDVLTYLTAQSLPFLGRKSKTERVKTVLSLVDLHSDWLDQRDWTSIAICSRRSKVRTVPIDVCPQETMVGIKFLCKSPQLNLSPQQVERIYRTQGRIETGYRDQHYPHIKLKSKILMTRLLVFMIAQILWNLWQLTRWKVRWSSTSYPFWPMHRQLRYCMIHLFQTLELQAIPREKKRMEGGK